MTFVIILYEIYLGVEEKISFKNILFIAYPPDWLRLFRNVTMKEKEQLRIKFAYLWLGTENVDNAWNKYKSMLLKQERKSPLICRK